MNLTKLEQETIIIFNEAEEMASIETCNKALIKQLDELIFPFQSTYFSHSKTCVEADQYT